MRKLLFLLSMVVLLFTIGSCSSESGSITSDPGDRLEASMLGRELLATGSSLSELGVRFLQTHSGGLDYMGEDFFITLAYGRQGMDSKIEESLVDGLFYQARDKSGFVHFWSTVLGFTSEDAASNFLTHDADGDFVVSFEFGTIKAGSIDQSLTIFVEIDEGRSREVSSKSVFFRFGSIVTVNTIICPSTHANLGLFYTEVEAISQGYADTVAKLISQ